MSVIVNINGNNQVIPSQGDFNWGNYTTATLVALAQAVFPKTGGNFFITGDINFGSSFGLIATYFTSASLNPAQSGVIRLASNDVVGWRNVAGNSDNVLGVNSTNQLIFNGSVVGAGGTGGTGNLNVYAVGNVVNNSTGSASGSITFGGYGALSVGMSNNTVQISGPLTVLYPGITISAGTQSTNLSSAVFSNSNNVSFGLSGSVITASASYTQPSTTGLLSNIKVSAGSTSNNLSAITFSNANGMSFGLNGSVITGSYTVPNATANSIGVSTGGNTAGNTGTQSGQVVFAGGANVTLSVATGAGGAQTISVIGAAGGGGGTGGVAIQNSQTTYSTGSVKLLEGGGAITISSGTGQGLYFAVPSMSNLTNAGAVSLSSAGSTITISAPALSLGVSTGGNTAGNTGIYSGQAVFVGGNNITLSVGTGTGGAQTITISGPNAGGAQTGISGFQVSNTTYTSGTVSLVNANGISFGSSGANGVSASYTVPSTAGLISRLAVSAGAGTSNNLSGITFANSNGLTFGLSTGAGVGTITGSYTVPTQTVQSIQVSASNTSNALTNLIFSNGNGVSFGLSTGAGVGTITGSVAAAGGAQTGISGIIVSNNTFTSGTVSLVNANGISFGSSGANGVSASYTVPSTAGLISRLAVSAGNGTSNNLSGITFANSNSITFGLSTGAGVGTITASVAYPVQSTQPVAVSGSNGSFSFNTLTMGDSNGLSFYTTNGSMVGSYTVPSVPALSLGVSTGGNTAGNTGIYSGQAVFVGGNNITLSVGTAAGAAQTITISAANQTTPTGTTFAGVNISGSMTLNSNGLNLSLSAPVETGIGISANGSSQTAGNIVFSNSNNVSFGMNGSTVTASASFAGGGGGVALYDGANSISSGTALFSGVNMTFSVNGQTVSGSVPAISSLVGAGGITLTSAGSTISVSLLSQLPPLQTNFYAPYGNNNIAPGQIGQGSLIFDPQQLPAMQFDRIVIPIYNTNNTISSGSHSISMRVGLYSQNGSSLSLISSNTFSTAVTQSGTLGSYSLYSGMRNVTMGMTQTLTSGNYWIGFASTTSSGGADGSYSNIILNRAYFTDNLLSGTLSFGGNFGSSVNSTNQYNPGQGFYSATTTGMPSSVAFSQIYGTNSNGFNPPAIYFRSGTF